MQFCESNMCCIKPGWKEGDPDPRFLDEPQNPPVPRDYSELPQGVIDRIPASERPKTQEEEDEFFRKYTNDLIAHRKAMGTYRRHDFAEVRGPHVRPRPDCKKKRDGSADGDACALPRKKGSVSTKKASDAKKAAIAKKAAVRKAAAKKAAAKKAAAAKKVAAKKAKAAKKPKAAKKAKAAKKPKTKKAKTAKKAKKTKTQPKKKAAKKQRKQKKPGCKRSCAARYKKANGCCKRGY